MIFSAPVMSISDLQRCVYALHISLLSDNLIAGYTTDLEENLADNIVKQITVIDQIVDKLDKGWIESEKIRNFLMKHYGIG